MINIQVGSTSSNFIWMKLTKEITVRFKSNDEMAQEMAIL